MASPDVAVHKVGEAVSTKLVRVQGRLHVELLVVRHYEGGADRLEVSCRQVPKDLYRIHLHCGFLLILA